MSQKVHISLGFKRYNDQQLATLAASVIKGMTGNKAFSNPPADSAAVQTALDDYNAALAATVQGGTTATATKNNKREVLMELLDKLAHYVQTHCGNDREGPVVQRLSCNSSAHRQHCFRETRDRQRR